MMKLLITILALVPASAFAYTCGDPDRTAALTARLSSSYGDVEPARDCAAPKGNDARICANPTLREMARLADQAYVYGYETATGTETDHRRPERDQTTASDLASCTDEACLCSALIDQINGAMGADNPYGGYSAN